MLLLSGQVFNVFRTDKKTTKDGAEYGGDDKVQLLADVVLENGTVRRELFDLKVPDGSIFEKNKSLDVKIPVGAFSPAKGNIVFYMTGEPEFS